MPKGTKPMKSGKKLKNLGISLSLLISAGLLSGCAGIKVKVDSTCSWAEPIKISDETLDYLIRPEAPDTVIGEMNAIADHNDLYQRFCE